MRIDVHAHYWTDGYLDRLAALGKTDTATQRGIGAGAGAELDARLRLMDRAGIDIQVLSAAPQLPYGLDTERAVAAANYVNDEYAAVVTAHPDRFRAFAAIPMPDVDAAIAEITRATDELGMVGVTMNTSVLDRAITDPDFEPIFAELDTRGAVLYLHPAGNGVCSPLVTEHHITWMAGAPFEDTIAALQLITSGHLQRYPGVKIICSHLGGALPMLTGRADDHLAWEAPDTPEPPSQAVHRLWFDTVSHCHEPALRCAIDTFGADRILLGTDFPYEDGDTFVRAVEYVMDVADPGEAHAILDANAMALFHLA
ncbi:amidohydrolase family protein [Mycolicibacterium gadium]|uniref:Amidohydrolase n=1 Tax=Mycolicibacterium gadium TaxID=1794 RepID=A0ABT6GN83_MYCGU|nr:amidohydrolase family protein [Mycolicibacterium gadium]MDG5483158.1 amidohydrolase [Mycolicibacterium gadium]